MKKIIILLILVMFLSFNAFAQSIIVRPYNSVIIGTNFSNNSFIQTNPGSVQSIISGASDALKNFTIDRGIYNQLERIAKIETYIPTNIKFEDEMKTWISNESKEELLNILTNESAIMLTPTPTSNESVMAATPNESVMATPNESVIATPNESVMATPNEFVMAIKNEPVKATIIPPAKPEPPIIKAMPIIHYNEDKNKNDNTLDKLFESIK